MFNVFLGKTDGNKKSKKYNSNDIINVCPSAIKNKIEKFIVALGVYLGEFEDTTMTSFEEYPYALDFARYFKNKLNQNEVLITSPYPKSNFKKCNNFIVECDNYFENLDELIKNIYGGTIFTDTDKIILTMNDFYGSVNKTILKLKKLGYKIKHNIIYVKSIK